MWSLFSQSLPSAAEKPEKTQVIILGCALKTAGMWHYSRARNTGLRGQGTSTSMGEEWSEFSGQKGGKGITGRGNNKFKGPRAFNKFKESSIFQLSEGVARWW